MYEIAIIFILFPKPDTDNNCTKKKEMCRQRNMNTKKNILQPLQIMGHNKNI